jgi:mono/diheme cytochrome c family protein
MRVAENHRRHGRTCPGHPRLFRFCSAALILLLLLAPFSAQAQSAAHFSPAYKFTEQGGEQLFANVCQGCHMPDAKGAVGAGTYPSLAGNKNLEAGGYPAYVVVRGPRAMPSFGVMMSDDQVAAVVNYLRTHFGNDYQDAVTAEDVKVVRP